MAGQIDFLSLPLELHYTFCDELEFNDLTHLRAVSVNFRARVDVYLSSCIAIAAAHPQEGPLSFQEIFQEVSSAPGTSSDQRILVQRLYSILKRVWEEKGYDLQTLPRMPFRTEDFNGVQEIAKIQQAIALQEDSALEKVWPRIRRSFVYRMAAIETESISADQELCALRAARQNAPAENAPLKEVRAFLRDDAYRAALQAIKSLNLEHLGLTLLPRELSRLTHLSEIRIAGNQLREIPSFLLDSILQNS